MTLITKSEELMAVSVRQGVELAAIEAKVLLGYLEGHDYSLMMDDSSISPCMTSGRRECRQRSAVHHPGLHRLLSGDEQ